MDITPLVPKERIAITGYGAGGFGLNGVTHSGNIFLHEGAHKSWSGDISLESILPLITMGTIDLLLIGAGTNIGIIPADLHSGLRAIGVNVEIMDTGAACRTYNVVMAEGRRVAAALVAV